jgi:Uma2 family endonuclease
VLETTMVALPKHKMTVDEDLAWAEGQPGHYELYAGTVYAMSPERAVHGKVKFAVQTALLSGIKRAGLSCFMLPDGMTVRVSRDTAHEPDALVYCGQEVSNDAVEVPNPVILVEVQSPSTRYIDASAKLGGYFSLESVRHYLIVDPDKPLVIHHRRETGDAIATRIVNSGTILFDPPGIQVTVEDFYPPSD